MPTGFAGSWALALLWIWLIGFADYLFFGRYGMGTKLWLFAVLGVFSLLGIVFLAVAIRGTIQLHKFGRSELLLAGAVTPGGVLSGRMFVPTAARDAQAIFAELVATRVRLWLDGEQKQEERTEIWNQKHNFMALSDGNRSYVDFQFGLPSDVPQTSVPTDSYVRTDVPGEFVYWELRTTAGLPGVDFVRTFNIRVTGPARS